MKTKTLFIAVYILCNTVLTFAQTNVSGGIYTNTTWTLANSPYIVVDTVVVFPGVILTIEPGVVVKFDNNNRMEIRHAFLFAEGTSTDSITFTSNSISPTTGIWSDVFINYSNSSTSNTTSKFSYCNFRYAKNGISIYSSGNSGDTLIIKNSIFNNNNNGIYSESYEIMIFVDSCNLRNNTIGVYSPNYNALLHINNCNVSNNNKGVYLHSGCRITNSVIDSNSIEGINMQAKNNSIVNCEIKYNGIGIHKVSGTNVPNKISRNVIENNNIGIKLEQSYGLDTIICNKICNNSTYDLYYNVAFGDNISIPNNYWCTTDSTNISTRIYDGYDNINLDLVNFMPLDTSQCFLLTGINNQTLLNDNIFKIYPNPFTQFTTLEFENPQNKKHSISVYNLYGQLIFSISNITTGQVKIERANLTGGLYFFQLLTDKQVIATGKFIIE